MTRRPKVSPSRLRTPLSRRLLRAGSIVLPAGWCLSGHPARADVTKADNTTPLNDPSSWTVGVAPTINDLATWDGTVAVANTVSIGGGMGVKGVSIAQPGGNVTTTAIGASGITVVAATTARGLTITAPVVVGADQGWNAYASRTLTVGGGVSGAGVVTVGSVATGTGTVYLNGTNAFNTAGATAALVLTRGVLVITGATSAADGVSVGSSGTLRLGAYNGLPGSPPITVAGPSNQTVVGLQNVGTAVGGSDTLSTLTIDTPAGAGSTFGGNLLASSTGSGASRIAIAGGFGKDSAAADDAFTVRLANDGTLVAGATYTAVVATYAGTTAGSALAATDFTPVAEGFAFRGTPSVALTGTQLTVGYTVAPDTPAPEPTATLAPAAGLGLAVRLRHPARRA